VTLASAAVPGSSVAIAIDQEGLTTLTFFARDNAGNAEAAKTLVIKLDKTPPTTACSITPDSIWPPNK